jgi:DNA helicase HerA-like ATPase
MSVVEHIITNAWNRTARLFRPKLTGGLALGSLVLDENATKKQFFLPESKRPEHVVVLGKTGSGKSYLFRYICLQDIRAQRGFVFFDHHGDTIPFLLAAIAEEEKRTGQDLSQKVVVIEPANLEWSVGLNVLGTAQGHQLFVDVVGITGILKDRWGLTHFGARTEELLRNSLHVLAINGLTLLELSPFLSNASFRAACLRKVVDFELREYFETRFEPLSEAFKGAMRDPILNKTSEFTSDPHFRHILGQQESTFSFQDVLNEGKWLLIDLNKGRLGRHASTLGALILAQLKQAIFRRSERQVFTLFCDEIQNLLVADSDIDVLLAEARKFGVSVVSANQFIAQFPMQMRSAVQAVGTHIYFQLSSDDAQAAATALSGSKSTAGILKNLPKRQFLAKTGHYPVQRVEVPMLNRKAVDFTSLLLRSRQRHARRRNDAEAEIRSRRPQAANSQEVLHDWE